MWVYHKMPARFHLASDAASWLYIGDSIVADIEPDMNSRF
jgi:hypothetical protein